MWPHGSQVERLLDLGERKQPTEADVAERFDELATWLAAEGVLASGVGQRQGSAVGASELKAALLPLGRSSTATRAAGTSALMTFLAPAVGATPKTLANSLTGGLRASRPDHRWLLALHRVVSGSFPVDAWLYHRRTPADLAAALGVAASPDAGDALLLLSLIALWQRRRPTKEARGNRGAQRPRRLTPKPVAALEWQLISPGQVPHLVDIASGLGDERGTALGLLAVECALTEAHLAPHPSRGEAADQEALVDSGEGFLRAAERGLAGLAEESLVDPAERAVIVYRIARMRAWRDGSTPPTLPPDDGINGYAAACVALDDLRSGKIGSLPSFGASAPGLAMLLPQLRAAGARILP